MKRLAPIVAAAVLLCASCLDPFEASWFYPVALDAYTMPNNEIPASYIEFVELPGTLLEGEQAAPTLHGVWLKQCIAAADCLASSNPQLQQMTILYFHGNSHNLDFYWDVMQNLWRMGFEVFAIDYRGYGRSSGVPSEQGIYADGRTALAYVRTQRAAPRPLLYMGMSLGSTVAVQLATEVPPAGLILEAALASGQAFVDDTTGAGLDASVLMDSQFDNLGKIPFVAAPKLIMHGRADSFVRFKFGELLYENAREPKTFYPVTGAEHATVPCPTHDNDASHLTLPCVADAGYVAAVVGFASGL